MPDPARSIGSFVEFHAQLTAHGEFTADGVTDTYTVYVHDPATRLALDDVQGLPEVGDAHPLDDDLTVTGYRVAEHRPGELLREIQVVYERGKEESEGGGGGEPPTEIGILTALDYPSYTQSGDLVTDQESPTPVLNSAGDVFDSVPQYESLLTGVHFVRRMKDFPSAALALSGTLNSAQVKIYGVTFTPRTARVRVTARYTFDGSKRPWEMDVTVEPRRNVIDANQQYRPTGVLAAMGYVGGNIGWDIAIFDCGFQYKDVSTGEMVPFTMMVGGQMTTPQLPQKLTAEGGDGRGYSNDSYLIVRTAKGAAWTALKADTIAP